MGYLDKRLDGFHQINDDKFPPETLVIFLIDNVNLFRGKARHLFTDLPIQKHYKDITKTLQDITRHYKLT